MDKTVYILGAGFSMSAGAPSQEKIIEKIFEIHHLKPHVFDADKVDRFRRFLSDTLLVPDSLQNKIPLEDVFTPLDRCILENLSFRNLDIKKLKEIREDVYYLIGKTLQHILQGNNKDYIDKFAKYLVETCSIRKELNYQDSGTDKVSVITSNWDILLDTSIQRQIDNRGDLAVVDYCCYISSHNEFDNRVKPGLEILAFGGYNIKVLKLHGSLNWLQCPKCQRVYVDIDNKTAVNQYRDKVECRHCKKNFKTHPSQILTSNIIMPTYLKNLSNPQYRLIWQNAGVELSEASKIVFIGYSLPQADFEMRALLSRMVRDTAEIEVIVYSDDPAVDEDFKKLEERYRLFFGNRLITVSHEGAEAYIDSKF